MLIFSALLITSVISSCGFGQDDNSRNNCKRLRSVARALRKCEPIPKGICPRCDPSVIEPVCSYNGECFAWHQNHCFLLGQGCMGDAQWYQCPNSTRQCQDTPVVY